jgi:hypothetical protein
MAIYRQQAYPGFASFFLRIIAPYDALVNLRSDSTFACAAAVCCFSAACAAGERAYSASVIPGCAGIGGLPLVLVPLLTIELTTTRTTNNPAEAQCRSASSFSSLPPQARRSDARMRAVVIATTSWGCINLSWAHDRISTSLRSKTISAGARQHWSQ